MTNAVIEYKENYFLRTFDKESLQITKEQFESLEKILLDTNAKFVKIGEHIINTSAIKEVYKEVEKSHKFIPLPEITEEQLQKNLKKLAEVKKDLEIKEII